jgi:hypothetical protein
LIEPKTQCMEPLTSSIDAWRPAGPAPRWQSVVAALALLLVTVCVLVAPAGTAHAATAPSRFVPLRPCRLLDTRESPAKPLAAGNVAEVEVAERCGVSGGAVAAALTLTVIEPIESGYATMFATGAGRPLASALNFRRGETIANLQLARLGANGGVSVYTHRSAHFVVDVTGYFEPVDGDSSRAGRYVPTGTQRVLDTRDTRRPQPRSAVRIEPNLPPGVIAAAVTITTTDTRSPGFFTAYAADQQLPLASLLNSDAAGQTRSASAIVPVSSAGFRVYTQAGDHVIVDVTGYFTGADAPDSSNGLFVATTPTRLVDTRLAASPTGGPRLWDRGTRQYDVASITGGEVAAVAANFTVTNTEDSGYVVAYPARTGRPLASTVNYDSGAVTLATSSIVQTSTEGIAAHALEATHQIIDITGWFTGTPLPATGSAPENRPPPDRRVVIIGDSAMAGLRWNGALGGLRGFVASPDLESCRRLVQSSCRGREGYAPPTVAAEIVALRPASREDILVIATGYNDWHARFSADFDVIVALARAKGYRHIAWIDYRSHVGYTLPSSGGSRSNYGEMNRVIDEKIASGAFPEVRRWRFDQYTAPSVGWFTGDGVHQTPLGSWAVADWISRQVRAFDDRPCAEPWVPGGPVADPCPPPEWSAANQGLPDIAGLYGL